MLQQPEEIIPFNECVRIYEHEPLPRRMPVAGFLLHCPDLALYSQIHAVEERGISICFWIS
jgi:hypothetical protein